MNFQLEFNKNWFMQSSKEISEYGEVISTLNFTPKGWFEVEIPTTVVKGLVVNNYYENPYYGINLKSLTGYKTDIKTQNFESRYKPKDSPFRVSWWFRKEFKVKKLDKNNQYWLKFKGLNYSANIWLNGKRIAGSDYIIGTYRIYDIKVTHFIKPEETNVIALEVFSPNPDDLAISFVDWSPLPPDDDMGIWQPVLFYSTGPVKLKYPFIESKLNIKTLNEADLIISSTLENTQEKRVKSILKGKIESIEFQKPIELEPFESKEIKITSEEFSQLKIRNPRIWWPYQWGKPNIYKIELNILVNDQISDSITIDFGIREVSSSINEHGARIFSINGREFLARGAAWTPDMMLNQDEKRDYYDISLIKNLNFNVIRLEGKLASDNFWNLCDKEGILVLPGWVCCSHWEKWKNWKPGDVVVGKKSLRSQLLRLRNHPSLIGWFYGSDFPPTLPVEKVYLEVFKDTYDNLPIISSATAASTELMGDTGVKMTGPYTYVPPIYWYSEERRGVARSFNTETGPDVCIPPFESLLKFLPQDQQEVGSEAWDFHAGLGAFKNTKIIEEAIVNRYGETTTLHDFNKTAQVLGYECWRSMFEAHARNYPEATGVIGWMLNSPWPSLIWQLYDYYLNPNGAFYGAKKACEPLHVQFSYDDSTIWIVNTSIKKRENLTVSVRILTMDLEERFSQSKEIVMDEYSKLYVTTIPKFSDISPVYFLDLILKEESSIVSRNFYWLSTKEDIFMEKDEWFYTPLQTHADMSPLRSLPRTEIESSYKITENNDQVEVIVQIENISSTIAFFLRVFLVDDSSGDFITPVYWNDNCISLLPSEKTSIIGIIPLERVPRNGNIIIKIDGWNY